MKGLVFAEFLEMVDAQFGLDTTEKIIELSDLPSGGAYTNVGTYDHSEIITLVSNLSKETGVDIKTLVVTFGHYLVERFQTLFPKYFKNIDCTLSLLEKVNGYIHVEVQKLYEDAELPEISTKRTPEGGLILNYKSARGMGDLAEGMINGAIDIFGAKYNCDRKELENEGAKQCIIFTLTIKPQ